MEFPLTRLVLRPLPTEFQSHWQRPNNHGFSGPRVPHPSKRDPTDPIGSHDGFTDFKASCGRFPGAAPHPFCEQQREPRWPVPMGADVVPRDILQN